jgi:hypothetical protein
MVGDDLQSRRALSLQTKLTSLSDEMDAWRQMPKAEGFAIHTSQIAEVCGGLAAMQRTIAAAVAQAEAEGRLSLAEIASFERQILAALQIWDFYRAKFALRLVKSLRAPLALADDLAWESYRPARDRAVASKAVSAVDVREPPLVYPNTRWSPYARSREQAYELDESTGDVRAFAALDDYLRALPVPLVGIPWYQMAHLPDAVFIGHEVGHLVEEDFGLEEELRQAIGAALPIGQDPTIEQRRSAWMRHWRSEVFADVYGVLTTGPAYAAVLLDLLAGDAKDITEEKQPDLRRPSGQQWSEYPTRTLRAHLVCEAVRQLPADKQDPALFSARAYALEAPWRKAYGAHAMADYDGDLEKVVSALLTAPLKTFATKASPQGAPLTGVLPFTPGMERAARSDAQRANQKMAPTSSNVRILFAGVALAFVDDPERYRTAETQKRFRARLSEARSQAPRAAPRSKADAAARHEAVSKALLARLKALDRYR